MTPPRSTSRPASAPTAAPEPQPRDEDEGGAHPLEWRLRLDVAQNGNVKNTAHNLSLILAHDPSLRGLVSLDVLAQRVVKVRRPPWSGGHLDASDEVDSGPWTDSDTSRLKCWLGSAWGFEPGSDRLHDAVMIAAEANATHPVRDYLRSLPAWDGVDRLDHWLVDHLGVEDSEYVRAVGRWWLISAVARALRPGVKADHMLILEGPQGLGKSASLRALVPDGDWFCDSDINIGNKDAYMTIRGKWIIEIAELDAFSKKEASACKAFVASQVDSFRPP